MSSEGHVRIPAWLPLIAMIAVVLFTVFAVLALLSGCAGDPFVLAVTQVDPLEAPEGGSSAAYPPEAGAVGREGGATLPDVLGRPGFEGEAPDASWDVLGAPPEGGGKAEGGGEAGTDAGVDAEPADALMETRVSTPPDAGTDAKLAACTIACTQASDCTAACTLPAAYAVWCCSAQTCFGWMGSPDGAAVCP